VLKSSTSQKIRPVHRADNVSLKVESGETGRIVGPSGSGKTTLLRIIAGAENFPIPATRKVLFYGDDVTTFPPSQRKAGFRLSTYALSRHLNVF